jgi:hypothetical protein
MKSGCMTTTVLLHIGRLHNVAADVWGSAERPGDKLGLSPSGSNAYVREMKPVQTVLIVAAALTYGAVCAAMFLRANGLEPQKTAAAIETPSQAAAAIAPPPVQPLPESWAAPLDPAAVPPPTRIPLDRLPPWPQETTGAAPSTTNAAVNSQATPTRTCNVGACSRIYRSFDSETCTYQPYKGGPRQHCDR